MVDQANLVRANELIAKRLGYRQALQIFAEGGAIRAFVVQTPDDPDKPAHQAWVEAAGIEYPPQMATAIKSQIEKRLAEIDKELADLGVTGLDQGSAFPEMPPRRVEK